VGAPGRNRTCGTRFRKPLLYPLSYRGVTYASPSRERAVVRAAAHVGVGG
jgi:hypothetical protein